MFRINIKSLMLYSLLALFGGGMLAGCGKPGKTETGTAAFSSKERITPVEVVTAVREDISITKTYTGALKGFEQADVVSRIPERIVAINASVGQTVSKGQTLIMLDKEGPSSQYLQAEAGYLNTERNLNRMKALYAEGAISLQTLEGTQTAYDVAKANFDATKKNIELTAPISGSVVAVKVEVGDMANPGLALITIAQVEKMKVTFNMNEADAFGLAAGQSVFIESEGRGGDPIEGRISEVFRSADTQSRTFEVNATMPNTPDKWFKPGMFVKVKYNGKPASNALVIPSQAILVDGDTSRVFVVQQGKAHQKTIITGISDGLRTVVQSGLSDNEVVVTLGWNNLREGGSVSIVNPGK